MKVMLCGVRGSLPAPGSEFVRYGGESACVAVWSGSGAPALVLDGGTGLRRLSRELGDAPFRGTILLTHLHWDHTHGLPFFKAADREGASVRVLMPEQGDDPATVLARAMSPPHFPIGPAELGDAWSFAGLEPGEHEIEGFSVLAREIPHKGGRTFGYRVGLDGVSLAYAPDHDPLDAGPGPDGLGEYHDAIRELCDGVDLLVHDSHRTADELRGNPELGHSAMDYTLGLARECEVRAVRLFHHAPDRTDDELDALAAALGADMAREGEVIEL